MKNTFNSDPLLAGAVLFLLMGLLLLTIKPSPKSAPPSVPYLVKIIDEHEVRLCSYNDTLVILLENSSVLAEEKTIFIYKHSK